MNGKNKSLGFFVEEIDAARAYDSAVVEAHDPRPLNLPPDAVSPFAVKRRRNIADIADQKRVALFKLADGTLTITCDGQEGTVTVSTNTN